MEDFTNSLSEMPTLHVVRVLNAREVVVSGGADAGLSADTLLRILGKTEDLIDPVTGENLGTLKATKALVRIYDVAQRYALARTFRTKRIQVGGGMGNPATKLTSMFAPPEYETRTETLAKDPTTAFFTDDLAVEPGDPVEIWSGNASDVPSTTVWK